LAAELLVEGGLGGIGGVRLAVGVSEELGHATETVLKLLAGARNVVDDEILMNVGAAGEQGGGYGDADGAANVAHEIEEAAAVADLFGIKSAVSRCADGDEDEAETKASDEDGEKQGGGGDVEGNVAEVESRETEGEEAEGEKVAWVDFVGEVADDRHAADCADAARSDSETGMKMRMEPRRKFRSLRTFRSTMASLSRQQCQQK